MALLRPFVRRMGTIIAAALLMGTGNALSSGLLMVLSSDIVRHSRLSVSSGLATTHRRAKIVLVDYFA